MRTLLADLALLAVFPGLPLAVVVAVYAYLDRAYRHPERWERR